MAFDELNNIYLAGVDIGKWQHQDLFIDRSGIRDQTDFIHEQIRDVVQRGLVDIQNRSDSVAFVAGKFQGLARNAVDPVDQDRHQRTADHFKAEWDRINNSTPAPGPNPPAPGPNPPGPNPNPATTKPEGAPATINFDSASEGTLGGYLSSPRSGIGPHRTKTLSGFLGDLIGQRAMGGTYGKIMPKPMPEPTPQPDTQSASNTEDNSGESAGTAAEQSNKAA